ncbi:MAG: phosphate signaling complex protein PhoU [Chloroflexi bacterium]|nr:phosphate signaling complex protein PhoU [Chloroflexota bacterium]
MARAEFDRDLSQLEAEIILMGGLVESAIISAVEALSERDLVKSKRVVEQDDRIDRKENEVEAAAIELIRREAPIASDLRRIMATLFVASELERIGDYAEGIAKISLTMGTEPPLKKLIDIPRMADIALDMLKKSLEAFVEKDRKVAMELARSLGPADDEVDVLYDTVQTDLIELMKVTTENIERATHLLWAAHNLERVADRATNIAERAIYLVSGESVNVGA